MWKTQDQIALYSKQVPLHPWYIDPTLAAHAQTSCVCSCRPRWSGTYHNWALCRWIAGILGSIDERFRECRLVVRDQHNPDVVVAALQRQHRAGCCPLSLKRSPASHLTFQTQRNCCPPLNCGSCIRQSGTPAVVTFASAFSSHRVPAYKGIPTLRSLSEDRLVFW